MEKTGVKTKIPKKKAYAFIEDFLGMEGIKAFFLNKEGFEAQYCMLSFRINKADLWNLVITVKKEINTEKHTAVITLPPNDICEISAFVSQNTLVKELFGYCNYEFNQEEFQILTLTLVDTEGADWCLIISVNDEEI